MTPNPELITFDWLIMDYMIYKIKVLSVIVIIYIVLMVAEIYERNMNV